MREIKFRVWSGTQFVNGMNLSDHTFREPFANFPNGFEVMQYTGVKDRNGVEIYEGDIVKWQQASGGLLSPDPRAYTCVIEWGWDHAWRCKYPPKDTAFTFAGGHMEVIGNIHQNPELLTNPTEEA